MGMRGSRRTAWPARAAVAAGLLALAGCAPSGDVGVLNDGEAGVTVVLGEEDLGVVPSDGGVVLLSVTECYEPVVVTYGDGRVVELDGPLCPGQELHIGADGVRVDGTSVLDAGGS